MSAPAGGLAVVLGLTVTFWIGSVWPNWRPAGLLTAMGGVGLIVGVRWAWPTILLVAAAVFFVALVFLTDAPEDPIPACGIGSAGSSSWLALRW